jgi:endonuclease/exonuclease/phosphatase family metal-dependent hydrolase
MRARLLTLLGSFALVVTGLLAPAPSAQAEGFLDLEIANAAGDPDKLTITFTAGWDYTYKVIVAGSRMDDAPREVYNVGAREPGTPMSMTVPHARDASQASGAYSFVQIRAFRNGSMAANTRWQWIAPPPVTPAEARTETNSVKIATFNIRTWGIDKNQRQTTSWTNRRAAVIRTIVGSGAGVVLLQEASGSPKLRVAGKRWQFQDLIARMPDRYRLASNKPYTYKGKIAGTQGNRIIYDSKKYSNVARGYYRMPSATMGSNRWVPWVRLRSKADPTVEFYALSAHFQSGPESSTTNFRRRATQVAKMVDVTTALAATGRTVYFGGDFNTTTNTLPYNNVQRALVDAGFYNGMSTANQVNTEYPTTNGFKQRVGIGPYHRDYVFALNAPAGSYAYKNHVKLSPRYSSDHFMQSATMPVAKGPYARR